VIPSLSCVACWSPSRAWGVAVASKGYLGILVILPEMHGGCQYHFGCFEGMFQVERKRPFTEGTFIFVN